MSTPPVTQTITLTTPPANRKEIAEAFGSNQSAVRRIESLTRDVTVVLPDAIDGSTAIAQQALALAQALQQVAYVLTNASAEVPNASVLEAGNGITISSASGSITISLAAPVSVPNGGTSLETLPQHGVLVGNLVAAPNFVLPGSAGYVLTSNGLSADPSYQSVPVISVAGGTGINVTSTAGAYTVALQVPVTVADGGTSLTTMPVHGVLVGNAAAAPNFVTPGTAGTVLTSNGTGADPTYQAVPTAPVTSISGTAPINVSNVGGAYTISFGITLGTMATQNANAVAITGGTADGMVLGATTAVAARVTTLATTSNAGIGTAAPTNAGLQNSAPITGGTSAFGIFNNGVIQSSVTTAASINSANPSTAAASFTLTEINYYDTAQGTFGAGSTVTNQYGFRARPTLVGATNNYGFRGQIPAAAGRWNLYMDGTAANYVAGNLQIGSTTPTAGAELLQVGGSLSISSAVMIRTYTAFTNGAGSGAGTLTNAPTAGNPTKWIPVNDNGTTRYIPAW